DNYRLAARRPLGFGAEQVLLRNHLQDRPDVLRHAAVDEDEAVLQIAANLRRGVVGAEDLVRRQQPAAADSVFRIALGGGRALDELHPGPDAPGIRPPAPGAADPFPEDRPGRDEPPLLFAPWA